MGQPHPTLTLILDLDARLDTPEMRLEIQRAYAYVGNTLVRTHEPASDDDPIENTLHLLLKLGRRKYLYSTDEGSDELWNDFLEHWFYNAFFKLGNHMKIFNRRQREIGSPEIVFGWIDLELQNGALKVRMHTDSTSDILPDTNVWLTTLRTAINAGPLSPEVEAVTMPSPVDYERQLVEGIAAKAERDRLAEEQRIADEKAKAEEQARAEAQAEAAFLESPSLVAADKEALEKAAKQREIEALKSKLAKATGASSTPAPAAEEEEGGVSLTLTAEQVGPAPQDDIPVLAFEEEEPRKSDAAHEAYNSDVDYSFDEADFAIDYHIWLVEYQDGTVRTYDSQAQTFVD